MTGRQFGPYRLDRLIGRGSAGEVWLAHDTVARRTVALKILSVTARQDPDYRRRFEREAGIGARLDNPHVVPIHTFGEQHGQLFLDMAYIPGVDVAGLLRIGPMDPAQAVDLVAQVAQALDAAHAAGLVHRDVKPANIIVHASGFAYLIDFGIAHVSNQTNITATGFTVGTVAYMAPERFTGSADSRSDIYSLACVLYECLTAQRPFGDTDPVQQLHAHLKNDPPRVGSAPESLNAVIARGMAKQPADRYGSAGELARAALAALGMAQPISRTPPVLEQPGPTRQLPAPPDQHHPVGATPARAPAATGYPILPGQTRTMTGTPVTGTPPARATAGSGSGPHRGLVGPPNPTQVLTNPNPQTQTVAAPELLRAPAPQRNPLLTSRTLWIVAVAIILLGVVFAVVAACTALFSSVGNKIQTPPAATPSSEAPTATDTPTTEPAPSQPTPAPFSIPVAPGFTLTFPMPPGLTFAPQNSNGDQ